MGQSTSNVEPSSGRKSVVASDLDFLHEQILRHSWTLRELTFLTYEELVSKIEELNALSRKFEDCYGKQLFFEVKSGSDILGVLWKGTVRIKCSKFDPATELVEKSRELNLRQFLQVYNTLQLHLNVGRSDDGGGENGGTASSSSSKNLTNMDTSILLEKVAELASEVEDCCICLERKPEVSLPCTHGFCLTCIERWNVNHKTCPMCRDKFETTDETWVLEDLPNDADVSTEIQKSLFSLTR